MSNCHDNFYDENKKQLNLSHRSLRSLHTAIIETYGNSVEYIDLSHNRINDVTWIYGFPNLKCLILDNNRLREAHFYHLTQPLPNIHTLMLNKNELSDLNATVDILKRIFPNIEYLSLHGNAICPDNLLLQPFSEFVPYEYNYYRTILMKSLPSLKFLDHFSLDTLHLKSQTTGTQRNQRQHLRHQQQQRQKHIVTSTSQDLWSKVKTFLTINANQTTAFPTTAANNNCASYYDASSSQNMVYGGMHSEGNRYITNSDL